MHVQVGFQKRSPSLPSTLRVPQALVELLEACFRADPTQRPSASVALQLITSVLAAAAARPEQVRRQQYCLTKAVQCRRRLVVSLAIVEVARHLIWAAAGPCLLEAHHGIRYRAIQGSV